MKAVKLTKIQWNLNDLTDEEKKQVINTLPTEKGFTANDDFNVPERVPAILKKKYGHDIETFSFTECRIAETLDDLLRLCNPDDSRKELYTSKGELSAYGKKCRENLDFNIKWRMQLERKGTSPYAMPKILDEVMLGLEKISDMSWEKHTADEFMTFVQRKIWNRKYTNMKTDEDIYDIAAEEENECEY